LNAGSIDFGSTGEAPPIFAQAAGVPFVYVGNEPPNPAGEGILVAKGSPIHSVEDLKGKQIALNKGSNVHYLLVKALAAHGLAYSDITTEFLKPADGRSAFEAGHVDAWAIWDPFFTAARIATGATVLVDGTHLVQNREFFVAQRTFAHDHPDVLATILDEVNRADQWVIAKPREVSEILAPDVGVDASILEQIARSTARGVQPITEQTIADQQAIADSFLALNLIPAAIKVRDASELPQDKKP
jgi:sulfonate transport system substrate-binding protein